MNFSSSERINLALDKMGIVSVETMNKDESLEQLFLELTNHE